MAQILINGPLYYFLREKYALMLKVISEELIQNKLEFESLIITSFFERFSCLQGSRIKKFMNLMKIWFCKTHFIWKD